MADEPTTTTTLSEAAPAATDGPPEAAPPPATEESKPFKEQDPASSNTSESVIPAATTQPTSLPPNIPAPSSVPNPASPQPAALPAPPPPQHQQQHPPYFPHQTTNDGTGSAQHHPPHPPAEPLNLPPIHALDNHAFAQHAPQTHAPFPTGMGAGGMQGPTIAQYYPDMSSPDGYEMMDGPLSSGGRSKKDVKRRTKTGCLTCRKRRIKCDERHPVCRNCEKSKRECLGYDPVFRSQPGASSIHPAPSQPSLLVAPQAPNVGPSPPPPNHNHNHHTATGAPSYSPPVAGTTPSSASPVVESLELANPLGPPADEATVHPPVTVLDLIEDQPSMASALEGADKLQLRRLDVEELLAVRGQLSQPLEPLNTTPARIEDIKLLFMSYAVGIDKFLECRWFETKAMVHLLANGRLLAQYAALLDGFYDPQIHEPTFLARLESRETRIIWDTMCLSRIVLAQNQEAESYSITTEDPELLFAVKRLLVFETLVTGGILDHNPVSLDTYPQNEPPSRLSGLSAQIKLRELQFWDSVAQYLMVTEDQTDRDKKRDAALLTARALLDSFENRDIIYSMGIVRHIARFQPRKLKPLVGATDERDAGARLYVACKFLEDESQGKGTSQAVKRLAGMVTQYWDHPPYNM